MLAKAVAAKTTVLRAKRFHERPEELGSLMEQCALCWPYAVQLLGFPALKSTRLRAQKNLHEIEV